MAPTDAQAIARLSVAESTATQAGAVRSSGRWLWVGLAVAVIVAGLAFSWNWLVAAGLAPLLLALLPCGAMCALHLCMKHGSKDGGTKEDSLEHGRQAVAPEGHVEPTQPRIVDPKARDVGEP